MLAEREAFVGTSGDWPEMTAVRFDFGRRFVGEQVQLRFRLGTDAAAGGHGWEIDNISVQGTTNQPFGTVLQEDFVCGPRAVEEAPVLEARGGCGCASTGGPIGWWMVLGLLGGVRRRRR